MSASEINARARAIQPSATLAISAKAASLQAEGKDVLSFSAGEPDFPPPKAVVDATAKKLAEGPVGYAPVPGYPALRKAVAEELGAYHGRKFKPEEVIVSCGAKHSLANFFLVTLDPGDEVIFQAPYWVSYPEMVALADGKPVAVPTTSATGLKLTPDLLAQAITPRTKILILNSPSNPTGVGYTAQEVRALGSVLAERAPQAWILCDDIYRKLTYDGYEHASAFKALEGITERIVLIDGLSKSHAMTGFRIGFTVAPVEIVKAMVALQGQTTSGPATPSLWGAMAAMDEAACAEELAEMREAFTRRRRIMVDGLRAIPEVELVEPNGAFYCFADFSAYVRMRPEFRDDLGFASWLLDEKLVAAVPGTAFGAPGYLRLSFATSDENIQKGLARIAEACAELRG